MKKQFYNSKNICVAMVMMLFALAITSCQKEDALLPAIDQNNISVSQNKIIPPPDVPEIIQVPAGNKVIWHAWASGVQIYEVTQSTVDPTLYVWTFIAPSATLYGNPSYTKLVGTHYAGPTWQATTGPKAGKYVTGLKLQSVTQDISAIAWLLLQAVPSSDISYYNQITYIQRVNTTGGLAPTTGADADHLGEQASIPYSAEYYFYGAN